MSNRDISSLVKCDSCGVTFNWKVIGIMTEQFDLHEGKCDVEFFICPKCFKVFLVSVKDNKYYSMLEDLEKAKRRYRRTTGKSEFITGYVHGIVMSKYDRLSSHVDKLKAKYEEKFFFVLEDGKYQLQYRPR